MLFARASTRSICLMSTLYPAESKGFGGLQQVLSDIFDYRIKFYYSLNGAFRVCNYGDFIFSNVSSIRSRVSDVIHCC